MFSTTAVVCCEHRSTKFVHVMNYDKKHSCRRETARRFVSLNMLLSHSRSFVSLTVSEIFSGKERSDLVTVGRGRSRSLKMAPFGRSYTTSYSSAILNIALSCTCTVFELFYVE